MRPRGVVALVAIGVVFAAGAAQAGEEHALRVKPARLGIYDASGKKIAEPVGTFESGYPYSWDGALEVEGVAVVLRFDKNEISAPGGTSYIYWETEDCTGPPLLSSPYDEEPGYMFPLVEIATPGWTLLVARPGDPSQLRLLRSQKSSSDAVCYPIPDGQPIELLTKPAVALGDLRTVLRPPFRVGTSKDEMESEEAVTGPPPRRQAPALRAR